MKTACPNCDGSRFTWDCTTKNNSDVVDGRLRLHDVGIVFYQGCDDCSETVQMLSGEKVAALLNQSAPAVAALPT